MICFTRTKKGTYRKNKMYFRLFLLLEIGSFYQETGVIIVNALCRASSMYAF